MTAPNTDERHFYLRAWREWAGLSMGELARMIHTTHSRISEVESGAERYNETFLARVAKAIGVPEWAILMGPPERVLPFLEFYLAVPSERYEEVRQIAAVFSRSNKKTSE